MRAFAPALYHGTSDALCLAGTRRCGQPYRGGTLMKNVRMLTRVVALGLAGILSLGTIGTVQLSAKDNNTITAIQVPVVGTTSSGGTFAGTATITGFMASGKNVVATGTISGLVNGTQSVLASFSAPVALPSASGAPPAVAKAAATCEILNLVLGPINLNVLG